MVLRPIDNYFLQQEEPTKSCLLFLRQTILKKDGNITEAWKYGMPFYCYHGKMFCYLWVHKKYQQPYIGIVEGKRIDHPDLLLQTLKSVHGCGRLAIGAEGAEAVALPVIVAFRLPVKDAEAAYRPGFTDDVFQKGFGVGGVVFGETYFADHDLFAVAGDHCLHIGFAFGIEGRVIAGGRIEGHADDIPGGAVGLQTVE